jgi:hypothetical protein
MQHADLAHPGRQRVERREHVEVTANLVYRVFWRRRTKPVDDTASDRIPAPHVARAVAGDHSQPGCEVARPVTLRVDEQLDERLMDGIHGSVVIAGDAANRGDNPWIFGTKEVGDVEQSRVER